MIWTRVIKRKNEMIHLILQSVVEYNAQYEETFTFDINEKILHQITTNIANVLSKWNGGRGYKYPITTNRQAKHKVRTYWNREKPVPLGNYLFSYTFGALFQYVMNEFDAELAKKERLLLFIHIFEKILTENIKFKKSMRRPLVLDAKSIANISICESQTLLSEFAGADTRKINKKKNAKTDSDKNLNTNRKNRTRTKSLCYSYDKNSNKLNISQIIKTYHINNKWMQNNNNNNNNKM